MRMAARRPAWASEMTRRTSLSPACSQAAQEAGPERLVLAVAEVDAEDLPVTTGGDAGGHDDGPGHDLPQGVVADMHVGGVEVHVREADVTECAATERPDVLVESGADSRHLRLRDSRVETHRRHQVVDGAGRHTGHVGLHHHRVQGLVDAPTWFQQRREERPGAELGDRYVEIAGLRRQHPRAVTVALGDPALGAFVAAGADRRRGFGLDQLLQRPAGELVDQIYAVGYLQRGEQIGQGRLRQSHRCVLLR